MLRTRTIALLTVIIIATGFAMFWPNVSDAASSSEDHATVPSFPITVNGTVIDQFHSSYPLLLYRDITYFPMTWDYTSALGLTVDWNKLDELALNKNQSCAPLSQTLSAQTVSGSGSDVIPVPFQVKVNGTLIDNSQERYPILLYNNITYFPMTWRFTNEMFNWQATWNDIDGYSIQSCEKATQETSMQRDALNVANGGQLAVKDNWIYMNPVRSSGGPHRLVKAKWDNSDQMELSTDNAMSINVAGDWLYYIVSEPYKSNEIYKIQTDGTRRTLVTHTAGKQLWVQDGYLYFLKNVQPNKSEDDGKVQGHAGISRMSMDGTNEQELFADPGVLDFYLHTDQIYFRTVNNGENNLYMMNADGSKKQLLRDDVTSYIIVDDWIYYMQDQKQLRKISMDGSTDIALNEFEIPRASIKTYHRGWLYVTVAVSGSIAASNPIERVRIDGTGREKIAEARPRALYIAGDEMYFANWDMGDSVMEHFKLDK
ncbi:DUF5050 domain-containing protein [Paenibacillus sp. RC67]|uniref:DUF5050 domain-containing protein n=1 Tax=Paenibacillus sp. RC67 TaxID=3039392 RepID=UPI0024AE567E|nr:DUF5050 domain-containing protein [Paenibacillus sp. RC67]